MSTEPEDEAVRDDWKMSEETKATITICTQIVVGAEESGAHVLFAPRALEVFARLFGSDDYWSEDGWLAIKALEQDIADFFKAREATLHMEWLPMLQAWSALRDEVGRRTVA
jgi:hypothetical protein